MSIRTILPLPMKALLLVGIMMAGCASQLDKELESAKHALDLQLYSTAETHARNALAIDSSNREATFLLSTALVGGAVLGEGETFLSLLSETQRDQGGDTELETIARIAPDLQSGGRAKLAEARQILVALTGKSEDEFFQLWEVRLFETAGILSLIGANSADDQCNLTPATQQADGLPDDLDVAALDGTGEAEVFEDNIDNINSDATNAGLPSDFELSARFTTMSTELQAAIDLAGSVDQGTQDFFNSEFTGTCPTP